MIPIYSTDRFIPKKKRRKRIGEPSKEVAEYLKNRTKWEAICDDTKYKCDPIKI